MPEYWEATGLSASKQPRAPLWACGPISNAQLAGTPLLIFGPRATSEQCVFPSWSGDYLDRPLDFNDLLIENSAATFALRIASESMTGSGSFRALPSSIARERP
jgi:hypothetical protein